MPPSESSCHSENVSGEIRAGSQDRLVLAGALGLLVLLLCLRFGWIGDDAAITFRVIDNFIHGYGLRWNVFERVQAFTNPLWTLMLIPVHWMAGEAFVSTIILSASISALSVALMALLLCDSPAKMILCAGLWMASLAILDYSTSGLENPLAYLLVVLFSQRFLDRRTPAASRELALIGSLIGLARLDLMLVVLPAFLVRIDWSVRGVLRALSGFLPLILWEIFSVIYYGFPFPNTAYAKLGAGIPEGEMRQQGVLYLIHHLWADPVTMVALAAGVVMPLLQRRSHVYPLVLGLVLYIGYVVLIGGDFMAGRMLSVPCILAIVLVSQLRLDQINAVGSLLVVSLLLAFASKSGFDSSIQRTGGMPSWLPFNGVLDERLFYFHGSGLPNYRRDGSFPTHGSRTGGTALRNSPTGPSPRLTIGFEGYYAGPGQVLIDIFALADPLLARIPAVHNPYWRVGHMERVVPAGYLKSIESGDDSIEDPGLREFYRKLKIITQGEIWSLGRFKEIVLMNLGRYRHLIDVDAYRYPEYREMSTADLSFPHADGSPWDIPGAVRMNNRSRVKLVLPAPRPIREVQVAVDHNDSYQFRFYHQDELLLNYLLPPRISIPAGLKNQSFPVELEDPRRLVTSVVVTASSPGDAASLAYIQFK